MAVAMSGGLSLFAVRSIAVSYLSSSTKLTLQLKLCAETDGKA
jgi:hypothetical protein